MTIFDKFRNCITEPRCRDCEGIPGVCEEEHQSVSIPKALALDVLELLKEHENLEKRHEILVNHADTMLAMLKEQEIKPIIHCKDCKYGLYTGTEYLCDKHSGHENRLGEDQHYKEWHNSSWFCADGERRDDDG